jgi:hypothetical protein
MTDSSAETGASPAPAGLLSRFVGVITTPRDTFQRIVAHPSWAGMLLLSTVIIAVCAALPMTTEAGRQATLEQQIEQMEAFGVEVNEERYSAMQRRMGIAPYTTAGFVLLFTPLITLAVTGILFVVFNAVLGGDASFRQLFSVVVHASVISALAQLFTGPLNYFRGSMASATNLGVLLPMIDEASFLGKLLRTIDVFLIWWVLVLSIGLAVLYRRRTQPIAITLFAIYGVIAVAIAAIMSRLGGA